MIAEGFRVLTLEGLGLRNRCVNLKPLRFKLYGLRGLSFFLNPKPLNLHTTEFRGVKGDKLITYLALNA